MIDLAWVADFERWASGNLPACGKHLLTGETTCTVNAGRKVINLFTNKVNVTSWTAHLKCVLDTRAFEINVSII